MLLLKHIALSVLDNLLINELLLKASLDHKGVNERCKIQKWIFLYSFLPLVLPEFFNLLFTL